MLRSLELFNSPMVFDMFGAGKQFEIFNSIVHPIFIFMMNVFSFKQWPTYMPRHDKSMFLSVGFISAMFCHWMPWYINKNISSVYNSSSLPLMSKRSTLIGRTTFIGTIFNARVIFNEFVFTYFAKNNWILLKSIPYRSVLVNSTKWFIGRIVYYFPIRWHIFNFQNYPPLSLLLISNHWRISNARYS